MSDAEPLLVSDNGRVHRTRLSDPTVAWCNTGRPVKPLDRRLPSQRNCGWCFPGREVSGVAFTDVACPTCEQPAGRPCVSARGRHTTTHGARIDLSRGVVPASPATCVEPGCDRQVQARGLCGKHYNRARRTAGVGW